MVISALRLSFQIFDEWSIQTHDKVAKAVLNAFLLTNFPYLILIVRLVAIDGCVDKLNDKNAWLYHCCYCSLLFSPPLTWLFYISLLYNQNFT